MLDTTLLIVATALSLGWWTPQWWRLMRATDPTGVSAPTWALYGAVVGTWAGWSFTNQYWGPFAVDAIETLGAVAIVWHLGARAWVWVPALGFGCALLLGAQHHAGVLAVWVLGLAVVSRIPQFVSLCTTPPPHTVSVPAWVAGTAGTAAWGVWGARHGATVLVVGSVVSGFASAAIVTAALWTNRSARPLGAARPL